MESSCWEDKTPLGSSVTFQDYTHFPLSVSTTFVVFQMFLSPHHLQIRDNIALGDPSGHATDEDVYQAALLGGAESFVNKMPEVFDMYLRPHVMSQSSSWAARAGSKLDGSAVR